MQRNYWPPNRGRHIPYRLNQLTSLLSQIRGSRRSRFSKPSLRRGWAQWQAMFGGLGWKSAAAWVARRKWLESQSVDPKNAGTPSILVAAGPNHGRRKPRVSRARVTQNWRFIAQTESMSERNPRDLGFPQGCRSITSSGLAGAGSAQNIGDDRCKRGRGRGQPVTDNFFP